MLEKVKQGMDEFYEDKDQIRFSLWGYGLYRGEKLSRNIELSYQREIGSPCGSRDTIWRGKPLEVSIIQNYAINAHLDDKLFVP